MECFGIERNGSDSGLSRFGVEADLCPPSPLGLNKVSMGTTLVACKFDGGIIMAADSRTSSFPVVSNKLAEKINKITDRIYMARAGTASDTQFVGRLLRSYINDHAVELGGGPTGRQDVEENSDLFSPSVRTVASLARLICYNNRDDLGMSVLVGGVDDVDGPQLFCITQGGALFERECFANGSGSTYIAGLIDSTYKSNMDRDTALAWITNLVNCAIMRDNASGGIVRYVIIDQNGAREGHIDGANLKKLELVTNV